MTKINCFAVILLLLQWIELGQGTLKEEWELSSLERVWLEIFWRVNSAAAEARCSDFCHSFIGRGGGGGGGGDLDPHLSLAEHSAESARCSNPALHIGWSTSKQLEKIALSSTNLHLALNHLILLTFIPGKYCFIENEIHDTKLWNTFNWYIMPSYGFEQWKPQFWVQHKWATVKCALYSPTNYWIVFSI